MNGAKTAETSGTQGGFIVGTEDAADAGKKRHYSNVQARDYDRRLGAKPHSMEEYVTDFLHPLPRVGDMVVVYNNDVLEHTNGESCATGYYILDKTFLSGWDEPRAYVVDETKIVENVLDHRSYVKLCYEDKRRGFREARFIKMRDIVCGYTLLFKVNAWVHEKIAELPKKIISGRAKRLKGS